MCRSLLLLSLVTALLLPSSLRACPMCSEAVTQTTGAEESDQFREARRITSRFISWC